MTRQAGAFTITASRLDHGRRLDAVIAAHLAGCSRSLITRSIRSGSVRINDQIHKPGYRVKTGDNIAGSITDEGSGFPEPVPLALDVVYQDAYILVINKAPGLVVHPASGHFSDTLVNALLFHYPEIGSVGDKERPGIVHRLDKDTSGILVVARTESARENLIRQFKQREVKKNYLVLVHGCLAPSSGRIRLPIGRDPIHRKKMSIRSERPKPAETLWRVRTYFRGAALAEVDLKTGRTHQIRVHFSALGHPVLGDSVYGSRKKPQLPAKVTGSIGRQMLHAWRLCLYHPQTGRWMTFEAPIPDDMDYVVKLFGALSGPVVDHHQE